MSATDQPRHDVIIAGAGPVGLMLACELRLGGCSVLVLERENDPHSPLKELPFGRRGLSVPSIEAFDRRDLLSTIESCDAIRAPQQTPAWMRTGARSPAGHFAGIQFFHDQIDPARWPWRLPQPVSNVSADMASIEAALAVRAKALGVAIRRGCGVTGLEQSEDMMTVHASDATFRARWLIGCDGGRSAVRKVAGIGFAGTNPEFTGYSALVELADPEKLAPGRHYTATGMYMFTPPGTLNMADFDGGAFHRTTPITREHVEVVLRKITGTNVSVTNLKLATTWTDRAYQAASYRAGRVLLAGDAAHVHSPLGGQGLNLGLGDAVNLGWKLAAVVRGDAPDGLLDSYETERRPVGEQILDWSRAQVALMRPDRGDRALETILRDLVTTRDGATYFAERVWGVGLRHDLGGDHPLIGRSAPDIVLSDGTRLNELLRSGQGLLLDFGASPALVTLAARFAPHFLYVAGEATERLGLGALLVRPDGVVAWAAEDGIEDASSADAAASRWFGARA